VTTKEKDKVEIRKLREANEAHVCAQFMSRSEPWITLGQAYDELLNLANDPSKERYVAVVAAEVVGFIILDMKGSLVGYIKSIGVLPGWQKKGIGGRLMAFAEERIFRESPNVFICVSAFNTTARNFYQRLGYQVMGTLKDYLVSGYDELLLRKTIAPLAAYKKASQSKMT
jgi:ribosomal protein S18 acetylase RimI-like enzyme